MEHVYSLPLTGGPWNGKFLMTSENFTGTLVFSLKGYTGYYGMNGSWINVA